MVHTIQEVEATVNTALTTIIHQQKLYMANIDFNTISKSLERQKALVLLLMLVLL